MRGGDGLAWVRQLGCTGVQIVDVHEISNVWMMPRAMVPAICGLGKGQKGNHGKRLDWVVVISLLDYISDTISFES